MKCTDRGKNRGRRRKKNSYGMILCLSLILIVLLAVCGVICVDQTKEYPEVVRVYESATYNTNVYTGLSLTTGYCITDSDVDFEGEPDGYDFTGAAIFDVDNSKVLYANNVFEQLYPASTTKILTALLALENGNLTDVVTVPAETAADAFAADESTCGLQVGDQLTLEDLLYGMLLESGNDNAATIAYYIAGDTSKFAEMMNEKAAELYATNSHFVNSNGLHDESHYTTVYDLYLIFNECIRHQEFLDIINAESYTVTITNSDGTTRTDEWIPSNWYQSGLVDSPENMTIVGGKTGTTDEAGSCLILLVKDEFDHSYITIIMGASSKSILYNDMTTMIEAIPTLTTN